MWKVGGNINPEITRIPKYRKRFQHC